MAFPDGEQLTMWLDRDRTAAEIARFDQADAAAYLRLLDEYDEVKSAFSGSQFTPVGFGPSLDARLAEHPRGRVWQRRRQLSAWDVIRHEFRDRHVQAFMLWMAFQTNQAVDVPGSGVLAYSLIFGRQQRSWSILAGGSGQLTAALTGYLDDHGGTVLCGKRVTRLLLDGGPAAPAVETGRTAAQYRAAKAVLSTIHVTQLRDMAPAGAVAGGVPLRRRHLRRRHPRLRRLPGDQRAAGVREPRRRQAHRRVGRDRRLAGGHHPAGRRTCGRAGSSRTCPGCWWRRRPWPTRAGRRPGKHTVKLLSQQVYELPGPAARLGRGQAGARRPPARPPAQVRARVHRRRDPDAQLVKSPADYEQLNPHMVHGAFHGGDRGVAQSGALRPVPGWASHRMPIPGLYQTGATTHPGGSITGAPGRNAAIVLLHDLGHDPAEVLSAPPT